jgi:toxin ParE1/3/4
MTLGLRQSAATGQSLAEYRLSKRAYADVLGIAAYTIERFGIQQARRYRNGLERSFQMLADHPMRGRSAAELAQDLRRWQYESHTVFYLLEPRGILIVRVLHLRMDIESHPMSDA